MRQFHLVSVAGETSFERPAEARSNGDEGRHSGEAQGLDVS